MTTFVHLLNVGQGNMTLVQAGNGKVYFYDCNITDERRDGILSYVANMIGWGTQIDAFICSHRDADHIRGIKTLHEYFPIRAIWDSGYQGTSTDTWEYSQYMDLRRRVGMKELERRTRFDFGCTRFRILSAKDERLAKNANAQGIVIKVEHRTLSGAIGSSIMLTGDSDAETWRYGIMQDYGKADVKSSLLVGGHHGSLSFFDDPADTQYYYEKHVETISPAMTLISVGPNSHGHPKAEAIQLYMKHSSGSDKGNKVKRTDEDGNIMIELKDSGWSLKLNQ